MADRADGPVAVEDDVMTPHSIHRATLTVNTLTGAPADLQVTVEGRGEAVYRVLAAVADYYEER